MYQDGFKNDLTLMAQPALDEPVMQFSPEAGLWWYIENNDKNDVTIAALFLPKYSSSHTRTLYLFIIPKSCTTPKVVRLFYNKNNILNPAAFMFFLYGVIYKISMFIA